MLTDSHCHLNLLDLAEYDNNLDNVMLEIKKAGITKLLCVAVNLEDFPEILKIKKKYNWIDISVGVHPNEDYNMNLNEEYETVLRLAQDNLDNNLVAIGETGLDFFRTDESLVNKQKIRLENHIEIAKTVNRPLIIHTRAVKDLTVDILNQNAAYDVGGVMHCFTENWEIAKKALDIDFYISFSGIVSFKNAIELQEVAKKVPIDKLLIETDSPYLAPVPKRGKPNYPHYVQYVAEKIAELRNISYDEVLNISYNNYINLFNKK
tara:strand:- start:21775 stop:22566 length:792 start_codon:yes stop_codon:yes gene_type:complete